MIKILLLAAATIATGVVAQRIYESKNGITLNDISSIASDSTRTISQTTASVDAAARKVGDTASATGDMASQAAATVSEVATDGMRVLDQAWSAATGATKAPEPSPTPTEKRSAGTTTLPSKAAARNIVPLELPPIERDSDAPR